jgi:hypothetical protein
LTAAITTPTTDETVHIPGEAVQLANALLRSRGGPLEEELVASVGKGVMRLLRATDDTEVIQVSGAGAQGARAGGGEEGRDEARWLGERRGAGGSYRS